MAAKSKEKSVTKASVKASAKAPTKAATKPAEKAKAKVSKEKALTKTQLIGHLAEKFELPRKVAGELLESIADLALNETKRTGHFVFPGLGKLVKAERKARVGVNPITKDKIKIPAKTVVKFRVAKSAKDAIAPAKK